MEIPGDFNESPRSTTSSKWSSYSAIRQDKEEDSDRRKMRSPRSVTGADSSVSTSKVSNTKLAKLDALRQRLSYDEHQPALTEELEEDEMEEFSSAGVEMDFDDLLSIRTEIFPTSEAGNHTNQSEDEDEYDENQQKQSEIIPEQDKNDHFHDKGYIAEQYNDATEQNNTKNDRFQVMDINVSILGLSGILVNNNIKVKGSKNPKKLKKLKSLSKLRNSPKPNTKKLDLEDHTQDSLPEESNPVLVFVSIDPPSMNDNGTTEMPTTLQSSPLRDPSKKSSSLSRYNAVWPQGDDDDTNNDTSIVSSFTFQKQLERDTMNNIISTREENKYKDNSDDSTFKSTKSCSKPVRLPFYIPDLVEMQVGIIQGDKKILSLGSVLLVVSEEVQNIELNLPLHQQSKTGTLSKFLSKSKSSLSKKYTLDENAALRVRLTVSPEGSDNINELSMCIENSTVEIGTDNVATLWKTSPTDEYHIVEYTPPQEDLYEDDDHSLEDHNDEDKAKSQPPRKSESMGYWNCFDPSLALYKDDDHLIFLESMVSDDEDDDDEGYLYSESKTWDDTITTTYEEDENTNEDDDDDDNDTHKHHHEQPVEDKIHHDGDSQNNKDEGNTTRDDDESTACYSYDDSRSSGSFSAKLKNLQYGDGSPSIGKNGKKIDEKSVKKARETIRKFADRIGVDPEDLI